MKKIIILLSIALLFLQSCGNETRRKQAVQEKEYRYVEIEECTIPIPSKFKLNENNKFNQTFIYDRNHKLHFISIHKRHQDDYIYAIESIDKMKNMTMVSETKKNNFKIIESTMDEDTFFHLYGVKSRIDLLVSNKKELNYLLDYCQKTWKLDKGEK